jgi:hypothetical protein
VSYFSTRFRFCGCRLSVLVSFEGRTYLIRALLFIYLAETYDMFRSLEGAAKYFTHGSLVDQLTRGLLARRKRAKCDRKSMQDLEKIIADLLDAARKLPPGDERQNILKEIGRFRVRLDRIAVPSEKQLAAK